MAITKPVIFTSIEDAEVQRNRPVSEETVRKMIQNSNLLASLALVGSVRCIALNQPGVSAPNPDIWQLANGSQITHPSSPITSVGPFNRFTPDFTNRYIRGAADDTNNNIGGSYTVNLLHDHGGFTGDVCGGIVGEEGDERHAYAGGCHNHGINEDLSDSEPLEVAHQQVAIYLKIN